LNSESQGEWLHSSVCVETASGNKLWAAVVVIGKCLPMSLASISKAGQLTKTLFSNTPMIVLIGQSSVVEALVARER
nr:hypothetical protein [Pseudomonadota bacterium]